MTENEISSMVVDGATEVHCTLVGRSLLESVYEELRAQILRPSVCVESLLAGWPRVRCPSVRKVTMNGRACFRTGDSPESLITYKSHFLWVVSVFCAKRAMELRTSVADFVQVKGLGSSLWASR